MAQSTTMASGINSHLLLDDEAGAPVDISGTGSSWSFDVDNMAGQVHTFSGAWPVTLDGKKNASLSLKVAYSPTQNEGADLLRDWLNNEGPRTLQIDYPDGAVGSDRIIGEWVLDSLSWGAAAEEGGPMFFEASLLPTNTITLTTISS